MEEHESRAVGFYWIRVGTWRIGFWDGDAWSVTGNEVPIQEICVDEVDPQRIEREGESR